MSSLLRRDVPPRAAMVIVALVLVAGVVTGAPWSPSPEPVAGPVARPAVPQAAPAREPLDLDSLQRRKKSGTVPDLFANQVPVPRTVAAAPIQVSPPPAPSPPAAPAIPTLPYRYLGRMTSAERHVVFLVSDQGLYSAAAGDVLDNTYRVEAISDAAVTFRHLPLDSALTLPIPATP